VSEDLVLLIYCSVRRQIVLLIYCSVRRWTVLLIYCSVRRQIVLLIYCSVRRQIVLLIYCSVQKTDTELQIKKNSCQTLGPASKRVLPDLSTFCQTYFFFFRNVLIFHFQYSMIKGTILKP
jgi:hypothetical protein